MGITVLNVSDCNLFSSNVLLDETTRFSLYCTSLVVERCLKYLRVLKYVKHLLPKLWESFRSFFSELPEPSGQHFGSVFSIVRPTCCFSFSISSNFYEQKLSNGFVECSAGQWRKFENCFWLSTLLVFLRMQLEICWWQSLAAWMLNPQCNILCKWHQGDTFQSCTSFHECLNLSQLCNLNADLHKFVC